MGTAKNNPAGKKLPYLFAQHLLLRNPVLPLPTAALSLETMLADPLFMEALWLATPTLWADIEKWRSGSITEEKDIRKLHSSIAKYYQRMSNRCTPFGLFSTTSIVEWQAEEKPVQFTGDSLQRHTRLDMHYLCMLARHIASHPVVMKRLRFFPNTSIYKLGQEYRYVEYRYLDGKRMHQITAVMYSEYLEQLLAAAKEGIRIQEATALLTGDDISAEEAVAFIEDSIASQVLVSELEPAITGKEFLEQIVFVLERINIDQDEYITQLLGDLKNIHSLLDAIDNKKVNSPGDYAPVIAILDRLGINYEPGKIFQTDSFRFPSEGGPAIDIQQELLNTIRFLRSMTEVKQHANLFAFTKKFNERFEGQEVPILLALDTETGIPYADRKSPGIAPLKDDLVLPAERSELNINLSESGSQLLTLLLAAKQKDEYVLQLDPADFPDNDHSSIALPPSLSVMFRVVEDNGRKIYFEMAGNASATNLMSRFGAGHAGIEQEIKNIATQEAKLNDEIVFAEIIHLPESRIGNILARPAAREYEIPFLAASSLGADHQLPLDDLYLKAINSKLYLYSKRLKKRIIPRLGAAHNFGYNSLPVYHLLCDLQVQGVENSFSFLWGGFSTYFSFLPRVMYKNVILHAATWLFTKKKIQALLQAIREKEPTAFEAFLKEQKMPRRFVLVEGDNELSVDVDSPLSLQAFADAIKEKPVAMIREFLSPGENISDNEQQFYAGQYIATLINTETTYNGNFLNTYKNDNKVARRNYLPGSEWLYIKLYCGEKTADDILLNIAGPLTQQLLDKNIIDKWFFIRYADPAFHIRLRFHLTDMNNYQQVLQLLNEELAPLVTDGMLTGLQIDTYRRELERYGPDLIEATEELFYIDSCIKLDFLAHTEGDEREQLRWLWGMKSTDLLLNYFGYSLNEKIQFISVMKDSFSKEFNMNKFLGQQVNAKYNQYRSSIETVFGLNKEHDPLGPLQDIIDKYEPALKMLCKKISAILANDDWERRYSYIGSCIHMLLNRLFPSDQRLQEMVLYEFQYKILQAIKFREKETASSEK